MNPVQCRKVLELTAQGRPKAVQKCVFSSLSHKGIYVNSEPVTPKQSRNSIHPLAPDMVQPDSYEAVTNARLLETLSVDLGKLVSWFKGGDSAEICSLRSWRILDVAKQLNQCNLWLQALAIGGWLFDLQYVAVRSSGCSGMCPALVVVAQQVVLVGFNDSCFYAPALWPDIGTVGSSSKWTVLKNVNGNFICWARAVVRMEDLPPKAKKKRKRKRMKNHQQPCKAVLS